MTKKLYVGGLAYAVDDTALKSLFSTIGNVESANVIKDYESGRSKGFGFVEMSTSEEAAAAIQKLHGTTHEGRTIIVSEARPQEAGRGGRSGRSGGGGGSSRGGFGGGNGGRGGSSRDRY